MTVGTTARASELNAAEPCRAQVPDLHQAVHGRISEKPERFRFTV
jgi:hypothetical protein